MVDALAYIFPGQGAQYVGMGKDLYQGFACAKQIFDEADEVLGFNLSKLCFEGPLDVLTETKNCQLAVLVTSIAALETLKREAPDINANFSAGLSLGEYSALIASGAINFEDALLLVKKRAEFMMQAAEKYPGKMLAVIDLDSSIVNNLCAQTQIEIANRNCPGQVVVTGRKESIDRFSTLAKAKGAKRVIELEVSGAFHSRFMKEASISLEQELNRIEFKAPQICTISNVSARPFASGEDVRKNLALQIKSSVLWEDSVCYMASCGIRTFLEIGPGHVLKGILRKIDSSLKVVNIEKVEDIANFNRSQMVNHIR